MIRVAPRALLTLLLTVVSPLQAADRIVAIGDIHGGYEGLTRILRTAGLADEELNWSGGATVLVQTGDFLDRGTQLKEVVGLLQSLQEQAPAAGGRVEILLGNHEALNLLGIMRDVAPQAFAEFVDDNSEARREESYDRWVKWARQRAKRLGEPRPDTSPAARDRWLEQVPLGLLEYLEWISPQGELGRYLRKLPTVTTIDGVFFVHGGLPSAIGSLSDRELNERVWQEVRNLDECRTTLLEDDVIHETADPSQTVAYGMEELARLRDRIDKTPDPMRGVLIERALTLKGCIDYQDWWLVTDTGPLWFRGFAHWSESEGGPLIDGLLETRGIRAFVVGHTTQRGRIGVRFEGRVFLIDTGMLSSFYEGGRPAALEIIGDRFTAIYENERIVLVGKEPPPEESTGASGKTAEGGRGMDEYGGNGRAVMAAGADFETASARLYHDAAGEVLPFQDVESILEFLAEAEVVGSQRIRQGINQPWKLTLERDGVSTHAVFRSVDVVKERYRAPDGRFFPVFRDSYVHEVAAFELARMLGIEGVPPVVLRSFRGRWGSIQLWIENVIDDKERVERGLEPPGLWWIQQRTVRDVFDALINNTDRNAGNILIETGSWTIWLIDHTRSFFEQVDLMDTSLLAQCERGLYERLQGIDRQEVRERLEPYLGTRQLFFLFERWDLLLEHFEALIREKGVDAVLFDVVR